MTRISKTCTVILILFIQGGMFLLHAPCARSALSNQAEKLIVGFEQAELSRGAIRGLNIIQARARWLMNSVIMLEVWDTFLLMKKI